jgi:hypothetical protein
VSTFDDTVPPMLESEQRYSAIVRLSRTRAR